MANKPQARYRGAGFTLVEILVALAVLAIAVAAVVTAVSGHVNNAAYLRERTLAHWVAMNKVTELQVGGDWPEPGTQQGDSLMAAQEWSWQVTVSNTGDADVRRLDVKVFAGKDPKDHAEPAAIMVAYVGRPSAAAATAGAATGQTSP
jgi:general secretion pathway protein I